MKKLAVLPLAALAFVTACEDEADQPLEPQAMAAQNSTNNDCVSINDADAEELEKLRHVDEDRADEIIDARPFRNVNHLLQLGDWFDPRQPAEMVDGDPGVCEYDVAEVEKPDQVGPPFPDVDGVAYTTARVQEHHGGDDVAYDVGDKVTFAGFERGGTTVADFRVFTTEEQNYHVNWDRWVKQPHQTIMLPIVE